MSVVMGDGQRLSLQDMVSSARDQGQDHTASIRALKHSAQLREETTRMVKLVAERTQDHTVTLLRDQDTALMTTLAQECPFLFSAYPDIFNRLRKNELDVALFMRFLDVLKTIEDGDIDEFQGSVQVGELLTKIYVDSALKKANKLDGDGNDKAAEETETKHAPRKLTWREYRQQHWMGDALDVLKVVLDPTTLETKDAETKDAKAGARVDAGAKKSKNAKKTKA